MSTLYANDFGPGIPLGSGLVPGSPAQGAMNANLLTGGFSTVPTLADRDAIPVDAAEGLKMDKLSSGRRQVGMVIYVTETEKRYELKIAGIEGMSDVDKVSALADNTNWVEFASGAGASGYSEDDDAVYCFQIGTTYNPSHFHLAKLTVTQLRKLIYESDTSYPGYSQVSIVTDEAAGHRHSVVLTYNPAQHALEVVRVENEDAQEQQNHSAYPILADADVARRTGGNTFVGEQAINGGTSYGMYSSNRVRLQGPDSTQFEVTPTYLEFQDGPNLVAGRLDASYDAQAGAGTLKVTTTHFKVPTPRQADDAATKAYVDQALDPAAGSKYAKLNAFNNFQTGAGFVGPVQALDPAAGSYATMYPESFQLATGQGSIELNNISLRFKDVSFNQDRASISVTEQPAPDGGYTLTIAATHAQVQQDPTEPLDIATKQYVDSVVGAGGSSFPIEQNLNSNSSISVPSVAAVASILTTSVQGALAGTSGIPSATNKYLTDADPRILSATTSGFVTAQSSVFTRFPYDGSAPVGFANASALATATTNNDTIRYNRSYSSINSSVNFRSLYVDGQQNYIEVVNGGVLTISSCFIFDLDLALVGTGMIKFTRGTTYMRGSTLASSTIDAGCTLTLDGVRTIGVITGTGTLVLTGTCAYPSRVDTSVTVKDLRGVANATSVKATVAASSSWTNGELQGTQPIGSQPGMKFCDTKYRYEFMNGMNDTDGTSFVWVRTTKST